MRTQVKAQKAPKTQEAAQSSRRYRVSDRVLFTFGLSHVTGVIVEDRGAIGYGGRRLYRIEASFGGEPLVAELPDERLEPVQPA